MNLYNKYSGARGLHPIERNAYLRGWDDMEAGVPVEAFGFPRHVWRRGWLDAEEYYRNSSEQEKERVRRDCLSMIEQILNTKNSS